MKKRIKILPLALLLIIVIASLHFFYGFFTPYNYLTAQWDLKRKNIRLLQSGLPKIYEDEMYIIAPKYGFTYKAIGGCMIYEPLFNGANIYNRVMNNYLNIKLGTNWKKRFDKEVDSLFRVHRMDSLEKLMLQKPDVKSLDHYLDSISNGTRRAYIWIIPDGDDRVEIRVGEKKANGSIVIFDYYRANLNDLNLDRIGRIQY